VRRPAAPQEKHALNRTTLHDILIKLAKENCMNTRLFRTKNHGQSIPIIALILVVLFAMVGLSVDVGNTYAENRSAVRATNAAALAGMDKVIRGGDDSGVATVIQASFLSNGITAQLNPTIALGPGQRRILAYYLDSNGNPLGRACTIGNCGGVPSNVTYIQIKTEGTVDTYFARVVGQLTLPVKAQAFAGQCSPVKGVYPIAVNAADLDDNGFKPTSEADAMYGMYYDPNYQGALTGRRIWAKSNFGDPGSFSFMQWSSANNAGSAKSLADMLTGDGNLDLGFDEVVLDPPIKDTTGHQNVTGWPDPNSKEAAGYPLLPHQLSDGDWIYGNPGWSAANDVDAALDFHITNHTVLNLPIVDRSIGGGSNTYMHFVRMGAFILRDYSHQGGGNAYFDLVYVGAASKTACLNTNVNQGLKGLGISGQVYVNPRWKQNLPPNQPIAYNIVLDVSGSMSWDFNGYGTYDNSNGSCSTCSVSNSVHGDVQCEATTNPNPLSLQYTDRCLGGQNSAWKNQNERRIWVAKNAIFNFINSMGTNDMMRVIGFSAPETGATATASASWVVASNQAAKDALITTVKDMGAYNGDPYKTAGGTPGPQGLNKAATMFKASNGYVTKAPNGADYKPVVIYFTDGVANYFLDGTENTARDICLSMSEAAALTTADPCQIGTTASGKERPISAMITVANTMKADVKGLSIYVIGLAQAPATGLPRVANTPSMFFPATSSGYVQTILNTIQAQVTTGTCTPSGGYSWLQKIDSAHTPASPPAPGGGVFGYAYVYDVGGGVPKYTLPIQHDAATGNLSFAIPPPDPNIPGSTGVTPGTYEMEAYVDYKGNDGITRQYDFFINPNSLNEAHRVTFSVTSASTIGSSVPLPPIFMDLQSTVSLCP
jgi:hypothetical protein